MVILLVFCVYLEKAQSKTLSATDDDKDVTDTSVNDSLKEATSKDAEDELSDLGSAQADEGSDQDDEDSDQDDEDDQDEFEQDAADQTAETGE